MPRRSPRRSPSSRHAQPGSAKGAQLPPAALRLVEQAEDAEADGRISRALELYNEGLALAMQSLSRQPDLKPTIESYLRRAMKLQHPQDADSAATADTLAVGDRCRVETKETDGGFARRVGTVAFAGPTVLGDGLWIGVALDQPVAGRHDGFVSGVRYFRCPPECGVLVRGSRVERLTAPALGHHTPDRHDGNAPALASRRRGATKVSSIPAHQARDENHSHHRLVPQRATSPSTSSRRAASVNLSSRRRGGRATSNRRPTSPVPSGLSVQHSGSPPRWGSPVAQSRHDHHDDGSEIASGNCADKSASGAREDEIHAELMEEVSALRSDLATAEKQIRDMVREREELLETLAVAQDAVAAATAAGAPKQSPGHSSGAGDGAEPGSLRREKAMVTRERDRLKSRVGLLTDERESLKRQLSGLQRKLARRNAAADRGKAQEQEVLKLREENTSLRGELTH